MFSLVKRASLDTSFKSSIRRHFCFSTNSTVLKKTAVYSFGDGSNGALGDHSTIGVDAYEATRVPRLPDDVSSIAAGHYHSLAVTSDGEVWAWGRNDEGQLGRPISSPRDTWNQPEIVKGLDQVRVKAASASGVISAAIGDDGSLWVWGKSKRGQLGLAEGMTDAMTPSKVEVLAGTEIVKVSFGWGHALAQTKDGRVYGWGYSAGGRLGDMGKALETSSSPPLVNNSTATSQTRSSMLDEAEKIVSEQMEKEKNMPIIWEPSLVQELQHLKFLDVACGLDHSLMLCCDGKIYSCGDNTYNQLGRVTEGSKIFPVEMSFRPLSISAGLGHCLIVCEVPSDETTGEMGTGVVSWGWNGCSQLGRRGPDGHPGLVEGLVGERPVSVSGGRVHSIVLTSKKELWAWGSGRNGRLGLGSSADEPEPALVECLEGFEVLQAVAGFDHNLVLVAE
ncbi:Ultraviolet-B receptor UVR8 [Acorus calamus]|uniref:Ultraviolet-B receptor UVR8 n=1 Tax=Acorus calamus TaxID=4465 RepID=A0AAV9ER41_ACOCL|nr:Ultraviolet-B receptor UVR8 [Acorus calamus]